MNCVLARPIDFDWYRKEILEEDRSLFEGLKDDSEIPGLITVQDGVGKMNRTSRVSGLLQEFTSMQTRVALEVAVEGRNPVQVARRLFEETGEKVHPDDVKLATTIVLDGIRSAYCG